MAPQSFISLAIIFSSMGTVSGLLLPAVVEAKLSDVEFWHVLEDLRLSSGRA